MARTFPTDGQSPCDFYASGAPARALGHFQWDLNATSTPAGDAVVFIDVNDDSTRAGGTVSGLRIDYTIDADKTGANYNNAIEINLTASDNACFFNGIEIYATTSGNPTIETIIPIDMYLESCGSACGAYYAMRIQLYTGMATAADGFFSLRDIGSGGADFIMQFESAPMATYLFKQDSTGSPFVGGSHTSVHGYLRCYIAGNVCYIPLYT